MLAASVSQASYEDSLECTKFRRYHLCGLEDHCKSIVPAHVNDTASVDIRHQNGDFFYDGGLEVLDEQPEIVAEHDLSIYL